jgi:uncharacterized protein Yka (UPF0111/DUF47 family)
MADGAKIMTATDTADVAQLAMIEALRSIADSGKKTAQVLEGVQTEVRDIRERLIRMEAERIDEAVQDLEQRVMKLEAAENRREGMVAFAQALKDYGPLMVVLISSLVILLIVTGKLQV